MAGAYQLTPLKSACLTHCRSPLSILMQYGQQLGRGHRGPFGVGVIHGGYCVGCCWALMLVLVLVGVMNVAWMAVVATVVFAEKTLPHGRLVGRLVGVTLIAFAAVLAAQPQLLLA
jgi:predicted metal-binding membrane protein